MAVRIGLLIVGIVLLGFLTVRLGVRDILAQLAEIRWSALLVLGLFASHQLTRAWAFKACVPPARRLSFKDALAVRLSGEAVQFLTFSGPILAEPTKAMLLRRRGLTAWEGLSTTLAEYLACSVAAALMAMAGLVYLLAVPRVSGNVRTAVIVVFALMLAFVLAFVISIAGRIHIIGAIVRAVARLPFVRDRLSQKIAGLPDAENLLIATLRHPALFTKIMSIELLGQLCLGLELLVLLVALDTSPGLLLVMLIEGATKFITAGFFFVPGQVGVAEGAYVLLFGAFGLPAAAGFTVSFVRRIRSLITAGVGMAAMSRMTKA